MKRIKVIQIGLGHDHASSALDSILKQKDIFDFAGIVLPNDDCSNKIKYYDNIKILSLESAFAIEDLDAAIIETEEKNLTKYAVMAAERGLNIHMDKPGTQSLRDFERLISIVKSNKSVFHMGYMYRYNPVIEETLKKIKNGDLGEIYSVEAHMSCIHSKDKRDWLASFKGGMMYFLGCHLIDLIYRIQGEPISVIPMNKCTGIDGTVGEDYGMAVFEYPKGVSFAKTCASEQGGYTRRQLVICGEKGTVEIKPLEMYNDTQGRFLYTDIREVYKEDCDKEGWFAFGKNKRSEPYDRYDSMMSSFAKMVNGEISNPYTYDYELNLFKLILKACGAD